MTDADDNKSQANEDLPSLRSRIENLRQKKEEWFKKKEDLKLSIANLIKQIKSLKTKSDSSNKSISQIKAERDRCNDDVRELIKKVKLLNEEKREKLAKLKIQVDPTLIRSQIQKLEMRIETEAPSFDQEKKLMKQINTLKKQMVEAKGVMEVFDKIDKVSKQIDDAKNKAEEFHMQLKGRLTENKEGYSKFMELSKKINDLKVVQEKAFENFTNYKKEFSELNKTLIEKIGEKEAARIASAKKREHNKKSKEDLNKKKLKERVEEVEKKLKAKKILTTEDIIAFQGTNQ